MGKNNVAGISGVLGGLISAVPALQSESETRPRGQNETARSHSADSKPPSVTESVDRKLPRPKTTARRGRPPGRATGSAPQKEKVTLRVDAGLMEHYREWSWSQRCQLGELVERALTDYRRSRA